MRRYIAPFLALPLLLSGPALAAEGWHKSLKDGLEASAKSGKPVLVITAWARGV